MTYFRYGQKRSRLRREILAAFCFLSGFLSGPLWSRKRDSYSRCARVIPRILADTPAPWERCFEITCAESLMHRHTKQKGEPLKGSPFCFGAENGFPTQAYSSFTISVLRKAFSSKVTPSMRSSCTRLHPNAFDKDKKSSAQIQTQNPILNTTNTAGQRAQNICVRPILKERRHNSFQSGTKGQKGLWISFFYSGYLSS